MNYKKTVKLFSNRLSRPLSASDGVEDWSSRMGKERDSSNHAHEAHSYQDVAGNFWSICWTHHGKGEVSVRVIIMGSSVKLGHAQTTSEEFKVIMLEKFGFSDKDDLIVEFFEDSFENITGAAENLMK